MAEAERPGTGARQEKRKGGDRGACTDFFAVGAKWSRPETFGIQRLWVGWRKDEVALRFLQL